MPPFIVTLYSELKRQLKLVCDCAELCKYRATAARGQTVEPTEPRTDENSTRSLDSNFKQSCHAYDIPTPCDGLAKHVIGFL
jgi:hypothetical protein